MNEIEAHITRHPFKAMTVPLHHEFEEPNSPTKGPRLTDLHTQVQIYLDTLHNKVLHIKEKNQAEFLLAFKSYMDKIKRDLMLLKQKSDEQERYYKENDRIQSMEKQLVWFREESLKLYAKVDEKNHEIYELKFKIQELKKDKDFLENQVRQIMKKNRQFEVILRTQPDELEKSAKDKSRLFCTQPKIKLNLQSDFRHNQHLQPIQQLVKQFSEETLVIEIVNYISNYEKQISIPKSRMTPLFDSNSKQRQRTASLKLNQQILLK